MTRFWITLDQGIELVLMALEQMYGGEIFIPKIPSMKVKDFILALAPECELKIIGIRPGEKLHEVLITPEEARHTKEFDSHYVILPEYEWWSGHDSYSAGKILKDDFCFSSDSNVNWLKRDDVIKMI